MRFKQYLKESKSIDDVIVWVNTLNTDGRAPRGMKKQYEIIKFIKHQIESSKKFGIPIKKGSTNYENINNSYTRLNKDDIIKLTDKLSLKANQPLVIKKGQVTYHKKDPSSYKKFLASIDDIDSFLKTLKGYHKKAIKNLKIVFVGKGKLKAKASFKTGSDEIYIRISAMGNTKEEYGSLRYVILHELGHRYLTIHPQNWDYTHYSWMTTPYSKRESWSDEEKFAELFAMSHWPTKYKEYKDKLVKFKQVIK